jgi:hypothetical protein
MHARITPRVADRAYQQSSRLPVWANTRRQQDARANAKAGLDRSIADRRAIRQERVARAWSRWHPSADSGDDELAITLLGSTDGR